MGCGDHHQTCSCTTCKDIASDDTCTCVGCCGCNESQEDQVQYGAGDVQEISEKKNPDFSAEDIAKMNRIFGEMDLTSAVEEQVDGTLSDDDIAWLAKKFQGSSEE